MQVFNLIRSSCRVGGRFIAGSFISSRKDVWIICRDYHIATCLGVERSE